LGVLTGGGSRLARHRGVVLRRKAGARGALVVKAAGQVIITAALVVVPGPGETVTFIRQERGPYARWWLLPGGKVEFGEPVEQATRREAVEESGCEVGDLVLTGAYEIIGPGHHFVVWAYRSQQVGLVPERFDGHHVSGVRQERWDQLEPHPTDMPILNDAGVAVYPRELIVGQLAAEQITMTSLLTGEAFGPPPRAVATRQ
jgi:ADP-ribose pyrophosphatase YjhB (NUDIX family)